jgi:hypothetical protein
MRLIAIRCSKGEKGRFPGPPWEEQRTQQRALPIAVLRLKVLLSTSFLLP